MQVGGLQRICRRRLCQRGPRFVRCGCRGELRGRGRGEGRRGDGEGGTDEDYVFDACEGHG
jgi:hypothetical protein